MITVPLKKKKNDNVCGREKRQLNNIEIIYGEQPNLEYGKLSQLMSTQDLQVGNKSFKSGQVF